MYSPSCSCTYFRIVSSFLFCPTVLTEYPSNPNSPPHSFFFTYGHRINTCLLVMLFTVCIIFFALYVGTDRIRNARDPCLFLSLLILFHNSSLSPQHTSSSTSSTSLLTLSFGTLMDKQSDIVIQLYYGFFSIAHSFLYLNILHSKLREMHVFLLSRTPTPLRITIHLYQYPAFFRQQ